MTSFDYIYGILHAPSYRDQFANDLSKDDTTYPVAPDFRAFAEAGTSTRRPPPQLRDLRTISRPKGRTHRADLFWEEKPEHFYWARGQCGSLIKAQKTRSSSMNTSVYPASQKKHIGMSSTAEPHSNGSSTATKSQKDKNSGILNDPNGWFENPRDLITAIERIVHISVESTKIIEGLPSEMTLA